MRATVFPPQTLLFGCDVGKLTDENKKLRKTFDKLEANIEVASKA